MFLFKKKTKAPINSISTPELTSKIEIIKKYIADAKSGMSAWSLTFDYAPKTQSDEPKFSRVLTPLTPDELENIRKRREAETYRDLLFKHLDEKSMTDAELYNKVYVDRRTFAKIRNDLNYKPSKDTAILLALGLELSASGADEMLEKLGYTLSTAIQRDVIIRYCFDTKLYDIGDVNALLYEFKEKTL